MNEVFNWQEAGQVFPLSFLMNLTLIFPQGGYLSIHPSIHHCDRSICKCENTLSTLRFCILFFLCNKLILCPENVNRTFKLQYIWSGCFFFFFAIELPSLWGTSSK